MLTVEGSNSFHRVFDSYSSKPKLQFEISHSNASSQIRSALFNLISAIWKTPILFHFLFLWFYPKVPSKMSVTSPQLISAFWKTPISFQFLSYFIKHVSLLNLLGTGLMIKIKDQGHLPSVGHHVCLLVCLFVCLFLISLPLVLSDCYIYHPWAVAAINNIYVGQL